MPDSRYQLPELEDLCVEHICKTLRADTAMSYLLATSAYDDLQLCIQDFVVDFWPEISLTSAFELANAEVAAGVWGEKGGKVRRPERVRAGVHDAPEMLTLMSRTRRRPCRSSRRSSAGCTRPTPPCATPSSRPNLPPLPLPSRRPLPTPHDPSLARL